MDSFIPGNTLIAEFMGAKSEQWYPPNKDIGSTGIHLAFPHGEVYPSGQRYHPDSCLQYHKDWNWLMAVITKCQKVCKEEQYKRHGIEGDLDDPKGWRSWSYRYVQLSTDIDSMWRKCVEFIQWYNNNQP